MEEILWSDPSEEDGVRKSKRGAGVLFGPNITASFLKTNNLSLMIRSHELKEGGYEEFHEGKLITVFSASYYCGTNKNKGAFVVFHHNKDLVPQFHSFQAKQSKE